MNEEVVLFPGNVSLKWLDFGGVLSKMSSVPMLGVGPVACLYESICRVGFSETISCLIGARTTHRCSDFSTLTVSFQSMSA